MTRLDYFAAVCECMTCMLDDMKDQQLEPDDLARCQAALVAVGELGKGFSRTVPPTAVGAA